MLAPSCIERALELAVSRGQLKRIELATARDVYGPLAEELAEAARHHVDKPFIVAVSGTPGSGKSTLAAHLTVLLSEVFDLHVAGFSLDDFYLSSEARALLGATVHPLLATRGVPGTHNLPLFFRTLESLRRAGKQTVTPLPRFGKLSDNPLPRDQWPRFVGRPDVVLIDNWFWQIASVADEELVAPFNSREREQDPDGIWRRAVNAYLGQSYPEIFALAHRWIHLQSPSWEATVRWRQEHQADLIAALPSDQRPREDNNAPIAYFLQVLERWGVHPPVKEPDILLTLDENHAVQRL